MGSEATAPATRLLPQERIIDIVTYTASLSSDPTAIDPLLDTLRGITAQSPAQAKLTPGDVTKLHALQQELEFHLVHQEKMRAFDYESLHLHIQERFKGALRSSLTGWVALLIVAVSVLVGILTLLLPIQEAASNKLLAATATTYALIYTGAAGLFLQAVRNLTAEARRGYVYLCIAMVLVTASTFVQPLLTFVDLQGHPIAPTLISAPFILSMIFYYQGCRIIARLAGVGGRLVSTAFLLGSSVVALVVSIGLTLSLEPSTDNPLPASYAAIAVACSAINTLLSALSSALLYRALRHLTYLYIRATRVLFYAALSATLISLYTTFYWLAIGQIVPNGLLWIDVAILVNTACLHLYAAYMFNKMHRY